MARVKKTPDAEQLASPEPLDIPPVKTGTVKVFAKYPPFIDLIKDVKIGADPVEVEAHGWLQAQIDAGLLIEA